MTFTELLNLEVFTCDVRERLASLEDAGLIDALDYSKACGRFHDSFEIIHAYGVSHGLFSKY